MNRWLPILFFSIFLSQSFGQGRIDGFYHDKGDGNAVIGLGFEDSNRYQAGRSTLDFGRSLYYANFYGSYGIEENFNASISIPYLISDDQRNFQDLTVFVKYRVYRFSGTIGTLELSLAGGLSTPISNYELGGLNDIGQQATVIETRGMGHYQWNSGWFITAQSGYSFKLEEVPNSIPFTLKLGKASSKWYYDVYYDFQYSFGGIDYRGTPRPQNFKAFGTNFHKAGGTLYTSFSNQWGGYVSLAYTIDGRNIFTGPAYGLGTVFSFGRK